MAIDDNIKNFRQQHNLSQAELANVARVSDKAVSSREQNKSVSLKALNDAEQSRKDRVKVNSIFNRVI